MMLLPLLCVPFFLIQFHEVSLYWGPMKLILICSEAKRLAISFSNFSYTTQHTTLVQLLLYKTRQ